MSTGTTSSPPAAGSSSGDATAPPDRQVLTGARQRRLALLDSPLSLTFLETTPGAGTGELLRCWEAVADDPELRIVVDARRVHADAAGLGRLLHAEILSRSRGDGSGMDAAGRADADPTEAAHPSASDPVDRARLDPDPLGALARLLPRLTRPLVVAFIGGDLLETDTFGQLAEVLLRTHGVRVIVAGMDCTALQHAAQRLRIAFQVHTDTELALTVAEVAALLRHHGMEVDPAAAARIRRRSSGLPGVVRAVAAWHSTRGDEAAAMDPADLGTYLFTRGVQHWPSRLVAFVTTLAHLPRFSIQQAASITGDTAARLLMARMIVLNLGRMSFHPALRQQVFTWFEPVRQVVLGYLPLGPDSESAGHRHRRVARAARESFDGALYVASLVEQERLDDAESYLAHWLWDTMPNGYDPLWAPVARLGAGQLEQHPRLLLLRARVEPQPDLSAAVRGAVAALVGAAASPRAIDPWPRVGQLALAIEAARVLGRVEDLAALVDRTRSLVTDLLGASRAVSTSVAGDLLLIADAVFSLGNHAVAAEFGRYAIDAIEAGSLRMDPWGERRGCASRLMLVSSRERGLPDPDDAADSLAGLQFRWRDGEVVADALARTWAAIDAGDLAAAGRRCLAALDRVQRPGRPPALWYQHLWLLGLQHQRDRAGHVRQRYLQVCAAVGIDLGQPDLTPSALRRVAHVIGDYVPAPNVLVSADRPVDRPDNGPDNGPDDFPRWMLEALLLDALEALRTGQPGQVRSLLLEAIALVALRPISPTVLTVALPEEIREMGALVADHPAAGLLHLDHALAIAGQVSGAVDLTEREEQVLEHLRRGRTNQQIAAELFVSINTVKFHRSNLMRKLDSSTRQQLLETAGRLGL